MSQSTTSREFFDRKYRDAGDPWSFASSAYELGRYEATVRALENRRFRRAFEPGCSIGVLTERLAVICDRVDAIDISPAAVKLARERCKALPNVHTTCGALPAFIPDGDFDLVVFSEIGYYFEEDALRALAEQLVSRICTSGILLAAHWLGSSKDHLLQGDRVHEILGSTEGLKLEVSERHGDLEGRQTGFRLERWVRP
jgi:SAM-dependent methyltransferase